MALEPALSLITVAEAPPPPWLKAVVTLPASMGELGIVTSAVLHTERWSSCPHLGL